MHIHTNLYLGMVVLTIFRKGSYWMLLLFAVTHPSLWRVLMPPGSDPRVKGRRLPWIRGKKGGGGGEFVILLLSKANFDQAWDIALS